MRSATAADICSPCMEIKQECPPLSPSAPRYIVYVALTAFSIQEPSGKRGRLTCSHSSYLHSSPSSPFAWVCGVSSINKFSCALRFPLHQTVTPIPVPHSMFQVSYTWPCSLLDDAGSFLRLGSRTERGSASSLTCLCAVPGVLWLPG